MSGYTDDVLREAAHPSGAGELATARRHASASNPTCGDEIALDLEDDGSRVTRVAHRTRGCAFTRASASVLSRTLPGATLGEARRLIAALRRDLSGTAQLPPEVAALASVRIYPARVRCALLPWEALDRALESA